MTNVSLCYRPVPFTSPPDYRAEVVRAIVPQKVSTFPDWYKQFSGSISIRSCPLTRVRGIKVSIPSRSARVAPARFPKISDSKKMEEDTRFGRRVRIVEPDASDPGKDLRVSLIFGAGTSTAAGTNDDHLQQTARTVKRVLVFLEKDRFPLLGPFEL